MLTLTICLLLDITIWWHYRIAKNKIRAPGLACWSTTPTIFFVFTLLSHPVCAEGEPRERNLRGTSACDGITHHVMVKGPTHKNNQSFTSKYRSEIIIIQQCFHKSIMSYRPRPSIELLFSFSATGNFTITPAGNAFYPANWDFFDKSDVWIHTRHLLKTTCRQKEQFDLTPELNNLVRPALLFSAVLLLGQPLIWHWTPSAEAIIARVITLIVHTFLF